MSLQLSVLVTVEAPLISYKLKNFLQMSPPQSFSAFEALPVSIHYPITWRPVLVFLVVEH